MRKVIYSLILAVTLAVSQALADATSNLGWLLAFALQATFLWMVFIQRERLTSDLLAATAGTKAARDGSRLQTLYYATRLTQMARRRKPTPPPPPPGGGTSPSPNPNRNEEATVANPSSPGPRGVDVPEPGDDYDEPIAGSEGGPLPVSDGDEFDPDEEPA